jgi:hypothetical protein
MRKRYLSAARAAPSSAALAYECIGAAILCWGDKMHDLIKALPSTRRRFLAASAGLGIVAAAPAFAATEPQNSVALAEQAAIWGFPLVLTGRYLKLSQNAKFAFNELHLNNDLATPSLHVVGPNVDTIYGLAWLDLSAEPVVVSVPDANDRYYSFQFLDAYLNTFSYVGRRETGTRGGAYALTAPGWKGQLPAGVKQIASPTSLVVTLTRTLVKGTADLPAAQALQASYALGPLSQYPGGLKRGVVSKDALNVLPALDLSTAGAEYFDELAALVKRYPPTGSEAKAFAAYSALGLDKADPAFKKQLSSEQLNTALSQAISKIKAYNASEVENGWRVNKHITRFIADPLARAAASQYGPGTHIAEEALYFSLRADAAGAQLLGTKPQTLRFAPGQTPPVDAFWSLILYDNNFFLVDNPLNRYTINDRTEGLVRDADGGLTIVIASEKPKANANWLPAPAGQYQLLLRTYQPSAAILKGSYRVPALTAQVG